jgi:hypothetical protein
MELQYAELIDSASLLQVVAKIRKVCGTTLPSRHIFAWIYQHRQSNGIEELFF